MSRPIAAPPELDALLADVQRGEIEGDNHEREALWRSGSRRWLMQPHQLRVYDAFKEWNAYRQTPEYADFVERVGAKYDDVFMNLAGRRVGKTSETILTLDEHANLIVMSALVRIAVLTYFTAYQKDIGEIIVPLYEQLTEDCPREIRAEYRGRRGPIPMGLFYPNGSYIKLVGVDKNPNGLRGRFSDGMAGSEAAFMKTDSLGRGLRYAVKSILLPQFQRRPWAFLILETSQAEDPEHDTVIEFRPDCEARGAFVERTLDDNTSLDPREKAKAIRQSGGRGDPDCEREFFNKLHRDETLYVVPEFNEELHAVLPAPLPRHAFALVSSDPGTADMHAYVAGFYDFARAKGVVQWSWAKRNASTRECACVLAWAEWRLWGRWPDHKMATIPIRETGGHLGWVELLKSLVTGAPESAERAASKAAIEADAVELHRMASVPMHDEPRPPDRWRRFVPPEHFGFWDGHAYAQNPLSRVSDVDLRFIGDMWTDFGSNFSPTAKDDVRAQISAVRNAFGANEIEIWKSAGPVISHVKNAVKAESRNPRAQGRGWQKHPVYGHYDCLAALIYWWRNVERVRNPNPPAAALAGAADFAPPERRDPTAVEHMLGLSAEPRTRMAGRPTRLTRRR